MSRILENTKISGQAGELRRPCFREIIKEKELWLLILVGLLYFHRLLFLGETFFFRDLYSNFLPQKQLLADFLAAKEWPLWNPYLNGGQAYLSNIANAVIEPFNVLYWKLPVLDAFNVEIILRFFLFITIFRFPIRFLSGGIFPMALLAGYAIEQLSFARERTQKNLKKEKRGTGSLLEVLKSSRGHENAPFRLLLFSEPYYPGWKMTVDGKPTSIWRANYAFSGIFLERGSHTVKRYYRPDSLLIGGFGTLMSLGSLIIIIYKGWLFHN